jgi:photosystem II stability/assembly factor-like uncharacterized protein
MDEMTDLDADLRTALVALYPDEGGPASAARDRARRLLDEEVDLEVSNTDPKPDSSVLQRASRRTPNRHRRLRSRTAGIAALVLIVAGVGVTVGVVATSSTSHQLFPAGAKAATSPGVPSEHGSWRLSSVISHDALSQDQLPLPASMLSCPTSTTCFAVSDPEVISFQRAPDYLMGLGSGSLNVSTDGGTSWNELSLPAGTVLTTPLVCEGTMDCTAGAIALTNPQSIEDVAPSDATAVVSSIEANNSGLDPTGCDTDVLSESQILSVLADYPSVAANATTGTCESALETGVDFAMLPSIEDGIPADIDDVFSNGPALATREQLLASMSVYDVHDAKAVMAVTTDGGQTWSDEALPSGSGPLVSLTCPTASACMALTESWNAIGSGSHLPGGEPSLDTLASSPSILLTTDDGNTWSTSKFPVGEANIVSLSCSSATDCLAVGTSGSTPGAGAGLILSSDDSGATWQESQIPEVGLVSQAVCPTATACFAIAAAGQVLSSSTGGTSWSLISPPPASNGQPLALALTGISCASALDCSVTGELPHGEFSNGSNGGAVAGGAPGAPVFSAKSGPGSGPAMILSTDDGGASWSLETFGWQEANGDQLLRTDWIQCFAANSCIAIGGSSSFATPVLVGSSS